MSKLLNIIAESPFDSLERHMDLSCQCAHMLAPFMQAGLLADWAKAKQIELQISDLESQCDAIKQNMRASLHKGLYLPVSRVEVLGLIKAQDKIPNLSEDVAGLMLGRKMLIPRELEVGFLQLLEQALTTCDMAREAVVELSAFFASGFGGNISDVLEKMIKKINHMEHITDTCEISARSGLFRIEASLDPINVMFLYKIIGLVGSVADAAESVSDKIALLLAQ